MLHLACWEWCWEIKKPSQPLRCKSLILLARPAGIEPTTKNLEGSCSIQLSYGRIWHGAEPSRVAHNIEIAPHAVKHQRQPASPQNTSASLPSAAEPSPSSHLPAAAHGQPSFRRCPGQPPSCRCPRLFVFLPQPSPPHKPTKGSVASRSSAADIPHTLR